ncbi:hypothetical protein N2K95_14320 [Arthrobacter zhaoxinii]|uniref:Uncharacterized protein n=1 Tax=Arthrobacter zhaoxinii TaxID=2964616 RepID=A0ABY5YPP6_9MICC|nr:hypothetical protein [Arthrobacter zhaoxinii]UWX96797.1 hypothetical protein N2K95_14320 [Arthrobacter zhaoxinii]
MLEKELRQKLQPLRDDLARATDPEYDEKAPVHRLAKELNRSIQWVIRKSGGDAEEMHASYRLTTAQESHVREAHRQELTVPEGHPDSLSMTLSRLARDLMLPRIDVINEVILRGVPREEATPTLMLYTSEVQVLLEFFGKRWKWRQDHPLPYTPSADGRISFETYERIRQDERESLEREGLLPSRLELSRHPKREWPQIIEHSQRLKSQPPLPTATRNVSTASASSSVNVLSLASGGESQKPAAKSGKPFGKNGIPAKSALRSPDPEAAVKLALSHDAHAAGRVKRLQIAAATNTALTPPKPASVAQLQNRKVVGLIQKEVEGGQHTGLSPEPAFRTYRTTVSAGSTAVADLQETLKEFHPRMYATFFDQFRDVLAVDRLVARTMRAGRGFIATDPEHVRIINEVCEYSYGIFAYWEMGSRIGRKARSLPLPSAKKVKTALVKLRPMYMGVLTDLCHRRFVFWRVGKIWDLLEVRFDDVHDWLDGLATGEYVPLTTHHIPLGNYKNVAACTDFSNRDQDIVKFMSEAAENLRQGVHGVRGKKATNSAAAFEPRTTGASGSSGQRTLGYRPENTWLVPITITNGQVDTTLDEDFFSSPDDMKPHEVRSFYRRPRGSSPNAPRTEFVSGHIRGGRGAFADMKLLPAVTIGRR